MQVTINGRMCELERRFTLRDLLNDFGYEQDSVAIAIDGNHVPRHSWDETAIEEGQSVEIVAPMQGG
jgi:sulfur carrier protein